MSKHVYIKTFNNFSSDIECNEFDYHNVRVESTGGFITLYDVDGCLLFRCHINDIAKFFREVN